MVQPEGSLAVPAPAPAAREEEMSDKHRLPVVLEEDRRKDVSDFLETDNERKVMPKETFSAVDELAEGSSDIVKKEKNLPELANSENQEQVEIRVHTSSKKDSGAPKMHAVTKARRAQKPISDKILGADEDFQDTPEGAPEDSLGKGSSRIEASFRGCISTELAGEELVALTTHVDVPSDKESVPYQGKAKKLGKF